MAHPFPLLKIEFFAFLQFFSPIFKNSPKFSRLFRKIFCTTYWRSCSDNWQMSIIIDTIHGSYSYRHSVNRSAFFLKTLTIPCIALFKNSECSGVPAGGISGGGGRCMWVTTLLFGFSRSCFWTDGAWTTIGLGTVYDALKYGLEFGHLYISRHFALVY